MNIATGKKVNRPVHYTPPVDRKVSPIDRGGC